MARIEKKKRAEFVAVNKKTINNRVFYIFLSFLLIVISIYLHAWLPSHTNSILSNYFGYHYTPFKDLFLRGDNLNTSEIHVNASDRRADKLGNSKPIVYDVDTNTIDFTGNSLWVIKLSEKWTENVVDAISRKADTSVYYAVDLISDLQLLLHAPKEHVMALSQHELVFRGKRISTYIKAIRKLQPVDKLSDTQIQTALIKPESLIQHIYFPMKESDPPKYLSYELYPIVVQLINIQKAPILHDEEVEYTKRKNRLQTVIQNYEKELTDVLGGSSDTTYLVTAQWLVDHLIIYLTDPTYVKPTLVFLSEQPEVVNILPYSFYDDTIEKKKAHLEGLRDQARAMKQLLQNKTLSEEEMSELLKNFNSEETIMKTSYKQFVQGNQRVNF